MSYGSKSSNGWLLSILSFACQEYGWSWNYAVEDVSLTALMLLMRQKVFSASNGKSGFTLIDQEKLDNLSKVPWEELVKRNRESLKHDMKIELGFIRGSQAMASQYELQLKATLDTSDVQQKLN